MYRVGEHRRAYHWDGACPRLTGRLDTVEEWGAVPEEKAQAELGLKPCQVCAKES
ncbi:hypothetical protein Shyd_66090 [Streptomyces hydrogenans]|uniref:4Fe-4S Wbl-type domain-containing protein n=2 Tax=Streptomyces hydrogenans TaxID=1873719 RepID=A0ABQ3PJQ2_9ACTN|nr:hypothetical protein GCM10018784_23100 [Streptomyces hydrogenans]GHI25238.1 hypothetical protein Shyd_66090 [Streptomyces hydrogenans]